MQERCTHTIIVKYDEVLWGEAKGEREREREREIEGHRGRRGI